MYVLVQVQRRNLLVKSTQGKEGSSSKKSRVFVLSLVKRGSRCQWFVSLLYGTLPCHLLTDHDT